MTKQVYADNVDTNGVAYPTVGVNIRDGAKSAESVVKALQSDEITFDMQSIMHVLPFMEYNVKIYEVIGTVLNNTHTSINNSEIFNVSGNNLFVKEGKGECVGIIFGKIENCTSRMTLGLRGNPNINQGISLTCDGSGTYHAYLAVKND